MNDNARPVRTGDSAILNGLAGVIRGAIRRLRGLGVLWRRRQSEPPQVTAEYLRLIYRNLSVSSPVSLAVLFYMTVQASLPPEKSNLLWWATAYCIFLVLRWSLGLAYPRQGDVDPADVPFWSALSVTVQACNGLMLGALGLWVLPEIDPYAQVIGTMVVLVLVGAAAFSLAGRWIETLVYAPSVYLSFAWAATQQEHPYAIGLGLLILALFVLHLVYASNQRKSLVASFAVARRNADLARELQFKNIEFQELAGARSRLLATVSHDLRQPAHAIGLLSERALMDNSFPSVKAALRDLNELSQSLSASLTTLMDLTRLDAGLVQAHIGPVPLAQVLMRLEAEFAGSARTKGLSFEVDHSSHWVRSDPVLLHGVLANLVSNAVKYTRRGGVQVRVSEREGGVLIEVIDSGIGIHSEKLDLIFKEFVRLDASDSGTEGLGLGLSIVRRYASLLGHALSVQSQPDHGSTFRITMALAQPALATEPIAGVASEPAADDSLQGLKVLVVDNVDLLLQSMTQTLLGWGCQVQAARNMREALAAATLQWPDLVLSDHHLGDREPNGIELIASLRRRGQLEGKRPPLALLMTGDVAAQLEGQARQAGVQVMHKPVRPKVLQRGLIDLIEASRRTTLEPVRSAQPHG